MKKILFATTALVLGAGVASADVSISGYGRFGLAYNSDEFNHNADLATPNPANNSKTWTEMRLRLNIDANTTTDGGVKFGGKFRIQYDDGDSGAAANNAQFYFTYEGLTVQVGNVVTALDNDAAGLFYATEKNLTESTPGDSRSKYFAYNSKPAGTYGTTASGIYGKYEMSGFRIEASFVDPNQYGDNPVLPAGGKEGKNESSLVASYTSGPMVLAAGGTWNGLGYSNNNVWYLAGKYTFNDAFAAGLTYINEGESISASTFGADLGQTITAYGTYTTGPMAFTGFVSKYANVADVLKATAAYDKTTVFGAIGTYSLGGGTELRASLFRDGYNSTAGELGVKFKF